MPERLDFALDAAKRAGEFTLSHFRQGVAVDLKPDRTPVTMADRGAEQMIRKLIEDQFPGEHVLGEEAGGDSTIPDRWIVDPIDGTKSFIAGVPLYSTLISYERDFVPILGVAFFPALAQMVYAEKGAGAKLNGSPIRVSQRDRIEGAIVCCGGHKTMIKCNRWEGFSTIVEKALATRTWGDAYGHALVATGYVDAMIDPEVSRWDISAMELIVKEAGGEFTDFKGQPSLVEASHLEAISSNGMVHSELLRAFAP